MVRAKVIGRKRDHDGNPIGTRHSNPIMDTRKYTLELPNGELTDYTANLIAEHMYAQTDIEGYEHMLLHEITDHKKDGQAVSADDGFNISSNGNKVLKQTTKGWKLLCHWKDGTTAWVPLKDMEESYPVQVAEYAKHNKIVSEPAFAWWVPAVLRRRDRIIKKVKAGYLRKTHKYGIEVPNTVAEAIKLDLDTGTTYWQMAIEKEMKNVRIAFEFNDAN